MFAQAYDNPIPGYNTETVGNLRLFEALAEHEFQLEYFNDGNFAKVQHCEPIRAEAEVESIRAMQESLLGRIRNFLIPYYLSEGITCIAARI